MLSKSGLMSLCCNLDEGYILQVINIENQNPLLTRIFLSDGTAFLCADVEAATIPDLNPYSLVRVKGKYTNRNTPLKIVSLQVVNQECNRIIGRPLPFADFVDNGYQKGKMGFENEDSNQNTLLTQVTIPYTSKNGKEETREESPCNQQTQQETNALALGIGSQQGDYNSTEYTPICYLYPMLRGWTILARVIWIDSKKSIQKGQQPLAALFFLVVDCERVVAKCIAYKETADKWRESIKKGQVYSISNCNITDNDDRYDNYIQIRLKLDSHIQRVSDPSLRIPIHIHRVTSLDDITSPRAFDGPIDVAGLVREMKIKQETHSTKVRADLVLVDPIAGKEILVELLINPEEYASIRQQKVILLRAVKVCNGLQGKVLLKSTYTTDVISHFDEDEAWISRLRPFEDCLKGKEFQSLSDISYYPRSFGQHLKALELASVGQTVYSKINCLFMGNDDNKSIIYNVCLTCKQKKVKLNHRRSEECQRCGKIMEYEANYCLPALFRDHTTQVKICTFREIAAGLMKLAPEQFALLSSEKQEKHLASLVNTPVCINMYSTQKGDDFKHNVTSVQEPHNLNLSLIQKCCQKSITYQVKLEFQTP